MTASLVSLAISMNLEPAHAVALPTVIEVSANKAGMSQDAMVWEAQNNAPLRDYLAGICRDTINDMVAS